MTYYTCMVLLIFRFKCAQFRRALRGFAALRAEVRGEQATRAVTLSRYCNLKRITFNGHRAHKHDFGCSQARFWLQVP